MGYISCENMPLFRCEGLEYAYSGGSKALSQISLSVKKGERIAVLGGNGAGKSTLFLLMNGVLRPDKGSIFWKDNQIRHQNRRDMLALRKGVGIVFQDSDQQLVASTVEDEVAFGPLNLRLSRDEVESRVEEALDQMKLAHLKDRVPYTLSGGEKRRVCIADVMAMKSEFLLFDEPASSLDPANRRLFEGILGEIGQRDVSMAVSTHDVDFAWRWASRIWILSRGALLFDGPPEKAFEDEDRLFEAGLELPALVRVVRALKKESFSVWDVPKSIEAFEKAFGG